MDEFFSGAARRTDLPVRAFVVQLLHAVAVKLRLAAHRLEQLVKLPGRQDLLSCSLACESKPDEVSRLESLVLYCSLFRSQT